MNTDDTPGGRDRTAELLSQALHDEAAMVHTDPSALPKIRKRTQLSGPSKRSWVYAGLGAAAATAAVIVGVAALGDGSDRSGAGPSQDARTPASTRATQTRPLISITNITDGDTVSSPVTVDVEANAFEGTVNWKLLDDSGSKLDEGFVTAPGGMGRWSAVAIELGRLDPGTYTIQAFEYSAKNGRVVHLDERTFTVQ